MDFKKNKNKKQNIWKQLFSIKKINQREYIKLVHKIGLLSSIGFFGTFIVFLIIILIGGVSTVINRMLEANPFIYILAFVAVFAGYLIRFGKWDYYMKTLGLKVPIKKSLSVYLSVYSMNITPGKIGRIVAAYTLKRITKIKFMYIAPLVTMDIFTDSLGMAIFALAISIYVNKFIIYVVLADILLLFPFIFLLDDWFFTILKKRFKNIKKGIMMLLFIYGDEYYSSQSILNKPKVYLSSILYSIPSAFLNSLALFIVLSSLGVAPSLPNSLFTFSSSQLYGMISAIPGNMGVTDGFMISSLGSIMHLDYTTSSAATIMTRFSTLWFGIVLGWIFLMYTFKYWKIEKNEFFKTSIKNIKNINKIKKYYKKI
ncbi:MAG: lysylphosphatidylglycerol synthase transmembrane domain-containing protein [Candidatus Micrarchaeia archaeon]